MLAEAPWVWPASNTREVDAAILQATPNWAECPGRCVQVMTCCFWTEALFLPFQCAGVIEERLRNPAPPVRARP